MSLLLRFRLLVFAAFLPWLGSAQTTALDTVLIDFGTVLSPAPWNNLTDGMTGQLEGLKNTRGATTRFSIAVVDSFNNINTSGTSSPDPSLGLPGTATSDSFFGNVSTFGGRVEPTGAVQIKGLIPNKPYTFTIFASRTATDNREARYTLVGATRDSVDLDAASNVDRVVTATVQAAADSTIRINVEPGPNNSNSTKFYYLGALVISYVQESDPPVIISGGDSLWIDFGTVLTGGAWNDIVSATDTSEIELLSAAGDPTRVRLSVVDSFSGVNTAGTQMPDPSTGFPATATGDSFFGSVGLFGGQRQPRGAIQFSGLDPEKIYTFSIFASRTATDNREASYVLAGATLDTAYLDAASNTSRVTLVSGEPTPDSTLVLTVSPGPNNSNSTGFYYLGAIKIGFSPKPPLNPQDTVLVDFGGSNTTPLPWNNVTDPTTASSTALVNQNGFQTGFRLGITDDFNNVNTAGTTSPDPALQFPASATGDSFFGNVALFSGQVQPTAGIEITGLIPAKEYRFEFFASRTASDNREAQYVLVGGSRDTVYLNAASNTDQVAISVMTADAQGSVNVGISPGPNNTNASGFYYLGALRVTYDEEAPSGEVALNLLAPNGGEFYQVGATPTIRWEAKNLGSARLDYSTDGGASWMLIDSVQAFRQAYTWTVPATPTTRALVRISSDTLQDVSDATFTISTDTSSCRIVVLGSSTAAGAGASSPDSAWVARFAASLAGDTRYDVVNLALGGYTTFHILPTGSQPPAGITIQPNPDRNITKALSLDPFAIIINMPSNDAANNFSVALQLANFRTIVDSAKARGVRVFVATTQPRNFNNPQQIALQREVRDSIFAIYGNRAIDFWTGLAAPNGFISPEFDSGDGVHVNNAGHRLLFTRVRDLRFDTISCRPLVGLREQVKGASGMLRVFPNPTSGDQFTLVLSGDVQGEVEIKLLDLLGRTQQVEKQFLYGSEDSQRLPVQLPGQISSGAFMLCVVTFRKEGRLVSERIGFVVGK